MAISDLNEEQRRRLLDAIEKQKGKSIESSVLRPSQRTPKANMNKYRERLRKEMSTDQEVVEEVQQTHISQAMKIWNDRIDPRWVDAPVNSEVIQERVERLYTGKGTHRTSVVIAGLYGVGKTWAAYGYANEMVKRGILVPDQITDISEAIISNIANAGYETSNRLNALLHPKHKFFLIDDVGQGNFGSEESRTAVWFEIINHIYSKQLTLVMTTNLSFKVPTDANKQPIRDSTNKVITQSPAELWLGPAAFDRLRHIIGGVSGIVVPGDKNMRDEVLEAREKAYTESLKASDTK